MLWCDDRTNVWMARGGNKQDVTGASYRPDLNSYLVLRHDGRLLCFSTTTADSQAHATCVCQPCCGTSRAVPSMDEPVEAPPPSPVYPPNESTA
eukprot:NODE_2537_length_680_cov_38.871632_g2078_i0.p2 GENE.NODE_2537_length_680_cov_38.871632_g2078_i0~~NODE_2537_length_680_cov_38.871632_g2078_i0.p2  ORF type:complete len:94 (+),score=17.02 NODE_2537_length_680_cov_38.871632_g2078_i0:258-539(+)